MNTRQETDHVRKMLTDRMNAMTDQQVSDRYAQELLKLKTLNQFGRHSARFLGSPNTLMMKRCRRELQRRGLPVPPVNPPASSQGEQQEQELCS
jgi:hypothetical protein